MVESFDVTKQKGFHQKSSKAVNRYTTLLLSKKPSSIPSLTYFTQHRGLKSYRLYLIAPFGPSVYLEREFPRRD